MVFLWLGWLTCLSILFLLMLMVFLVFSVAFNCFALCSTNLNGSPCFCSDSNCFSMLLFPTDMLFFHCFQVIWTADWCFGFDASKWMFIFSDCFEGPFDCLCVDMNDAFMLCLLFELLSVYFRLILIPYLHCIHLFTCFFHACLGVLMFLQCSLTDNTLFSMHLLLALIVFPCGLLICFNLTWMMLIFFDAWLYDSDDYSNGSSWFQWYEIASLLLIIVSMRFDWL